MYRKALQSLQRQPSRLWRYLHVVHNVRSESQLGCRLNNSRGIATSAEELNAFGKHHVTRGLGRITEGVVTKQSGSYVEFMDGRKMLDFTCGIGVTNLGACSRFGAPPSLFTLARTLSSKGQQSCERAVPDRRSCPGRPSALTSTPSDILCTVWDSLP